MFRALSRFRVVYNIPKQTISKIYFSSHESLVLEAVPFQLTEKEAIEAYNKWVKRYTSFIFNKKLHIKSMFLPFWCFEFDVETTCNNKSTAVTHYSSHSGKDNVEKEINLSLTEIYGSYSFRRKFVQNIKTDLTAAEPLRVSMLDDNIYMDIWYLSQQTAWEIIKQQESAKYSSIYKHKHKTLFNVDCHFKNRVCRKVYLPAYIAEYQHMSSIFQVFINGTTGEAYGLPQEGVFDYIIRAKKEKRNLIIALFKSLFAPSNSKKEQIKTFKEWNDIKKAESLHDYSRSVCDERVWTLFEKYNEKEEYKEKKNQEEQQEEEQHKRSYYSSTQFSPLATDYEVLCVKETASLEEIQTAFRVQIHKWHPDVCTRNGIPEEVGKRHTQRIIESYGRLRRLKSKPL